MSTLFGIPVEGRVGPESFKPHVDDDKIDSGLVVEWKSYLTDCLENNFAVTATIHASTDGGTVLWIPTGYKSQIGDEVTATVRQELLAEFASECLREFLQKRAAA